jgi:hypothetical protein
LHNPELESENFDWIHDQPTEGGCNKKERPLGYSRELKRQRLSVNDIDRQYLNFKIDTRMEDTSDFERMFLLSLLFPAMKQLSPLDNRHFRAEVQETLRRKLRRPAAAEFQVIAYQGRS